MNKQSTTMVLVHGASQYSRPNLIEKWVPILRNCLGSSWDIILPIMPNPEAPEAGAWLQVVAESISRVEGRVCLVGHSLGGSVLLQHVARNMPSQEHLFVVAAPFWCGNDSDWQHEQFKLTDSDIKSMQSHRLIFYHGTTDDIVPFNHLSEYQQALPLATVRSYEGMNHIDPVDAFLRDLASDVAVSVGRDSNRIQSDAAKQRR